MKIDIGEFNVANLKVLQIASFNGNIGDNANHNGFRRRLESTLNIKIDFTNLEMREFYQSWNLRNFNSHSFIEMCNQHDLVVIGGGNFFELKWDYSSTGTTVNIEEKTLDQINTPIIIHGVGCDIAKGATEITINKFEKFLDKLTASENIIVSVRNDGSYKTIRDLYGDKFDKKIHLVPDGAFFMETKQFDYPELRNGYKSIGVNIVSDMKDIRFDEKDEDGVSYESFLETFSNEMNEFLSENKDYQIILFPHIYSDYVAINEVLSRIEDKYRRTRVVVSPLLTGEGAEEYIFGLYANCDFILGMRFHSNVSAIAQNIPSIALSSYKKILDVHSELNLSERIVEVNKKGFENELKSLIESTMSNLDEIRASYEQVNETVYNESLPFYEDIESLVNKIN